MGELDRPLHGREGERGFTLVELLVVIVIIGILAAVAVFAVGGITDRGEEAACDGTAATLRTASETFRADNPAGTPAADLDALEAAGFVQLDDLTFDNATGIITMANGQTITYQTDGTVTDTCVP